MVDKILFAQPVFQQWSNVVRSVWCVSLVNQFYRYKIEFLIKALDFFGLLAWHEAYIKRVVCGRWYARTVKHFQRKLTNQWYLTSSIPVSFLRSSWIPWSLWLAHCGPPSFGFSKDIETCPQIIIFVKKVFQNSFFIFMHDFLSNPFQNIII